MTYIALLRAINVGGHVVKMERLREMFTELGFTNVRTYIQSGNVFFETNETNREKLIDKIEAHLKSSLRYEVPAVLRTVEELEHIVTLDPFKNVTITPDMRLCVVFAAGSLPQDIILPWRTPKNDMEIIQKTEYEAFVVWYIINGRPPSSGNFLDKALGTKTTTRFFHTTIKILQAAKGTET